MIHYRNTVRASGVNARTVKAVAKRLLATVGESDASLALSLVSDAEIHQLNRAHRGKDRPTDVLSFSIDGGAALCHQERRRRTPERLLGDVVISIDTARRQAADYDASLQEEIYRLLIHGLLHVLGHDHERPAERRVMRREERRLSDAIGLKVP